MSSTGVNGITMVSVWSKDRRIMQFRVECGSPRHGMKFYRTFHIGAADDAFTKLKIDIVFQAACDFQSAYKEAMVKGEYFSAANWNGRGQEWRKIPYDPDDWPDEISKGGVRKYPDRSRSKNRVLCRLRARGKT